MVKKVKKVEKEKETFPDETKLLEAVCEMVIANAYMIVDLLHDRAKYRGKIDK